MAIAEKYLWHFAAAKFDNDFSFYRTIPNALIAKRCIAIACRPSVCLSVRL